MSYAIIGFGIYVVRFKRNVDIKSVAYDSNGSLWYAGCNGVGRLTRSHAVRDYLVDDGCNGQAAVSVAPDRLAWFFARGTSGLSTRPARCVCSSLSMRRRRCRQANLIRRITPQGTVSSFPTTSGESSGCGRTRRQSLGLRHDEARSDHLTGRTDKTVR